METKINKICLLNLLLLSTNLTFTMENNNKAITNEECKYLDHGLTNAVIELNLNKVKKILKSEKSISKDTKDRSLWFVSFSAILKKIDYQYNTGMFTMTPKSKDAINVALQIVQLLISANADLNYIAKDISPLIIAILGDNKDLINLLINAGANVFLKNKSLTPLMHALKSKNWEIVKLIGDAKRNIHDQIRILTQAISNNNNKTIKDLLFKNSNLTDKDDNNALHIAAKKNNYLMFNYIWLIQPKLFDKKNFKKQTATDEYPEIIGLLISNKILTLAQEKKENKKGKFEEINDNTQNENK